MTFAELTASLLDKNYELGRNDCFMLIFNYLKAKDSNIPTEHEGISVEGYKILFEQDPVKAKKIMLDAIVQYLKEIKPRQAIAGDVLLLRLEGHPEFLGIDAGNGNTMVSAPRVGVTVVPKRHYEVMRAFRCQQQ